MSVATGAAARSGPAFTEEQRAAIDDRSGSSLLGASAGSGKTAVMVERFAEAVLEDGLAVGAVLAITFTEKAAAELRDRVRRRFAERGEEEHARGVDAAWIGTIHGFCARVLRGRALAAGLDPRFTVLDEPAATRLADAAFARALETWVASGGAAALDLAAAYGPNLRPAVLATHAALRSRGQSRPALPEVPAGAAPDHEALRAASGSARAALTAMKDGKRVSAGLAALDACDLVLASGAIPSPGDLDTALLRGGKPLDTEPCDAYREALTAFRAACAGHHARAALVPLGALLREYDVAYREAKAQRFAVDFADLELHVRDLLEADPGVRRRLASRFELIMVDEFQDTNRVQLDLLEHLERDNLFAVGDEFQAIYGFRHADVTLFRERRAALGPQRARRLTANFRSAESVLDVINGAFAPLWPSFAPLVAGAGRAGAVPAGASGAASVAGAWGVTSARADAGGWADDASGLLRLFDPDVPLAPAPDAPSVELLVTACEAFEDPRTAEARAVARRLRAEVDAGRAAKDIVILVRATASLRPLEDALEDAGLPTYVVGGRGYWSGEQVRDALAYLAVLSNPLDERALYTVLASPFCGVGADALVLLAAAGRAGAALGPAAALDLLATGPAAWAAPLAAQDRERLARFARILREQRAAAERLAIDERLEQGIVATGYDLAVLARRGGERRMANLRKLARLAREHERAEGRDVRGFLVYAAEQDLAEAREGDAPLEGEGLDAIRLMTIHRAKGLEFPVVCVADLGRPGKKERPVLAVGQDGRVGLRLSTLGGGKAVPALDYDALAAEADAAADEEERRLLYVAMTRAEERLILSGAADRAKLPGPRPGGAPIAWLLPALLDHPAAALAAGGGDHERVWDGRPARLRLTVVTPDDPPASPGAPRPRADAPGTALPAEPKAGPAPVPVRPSPRRLSYSALQSYARCPYRFYAERVLRLPRVPVPLEPPAAGTVAAPADEARAEARPPLDPLVRGSIAHSLLETLDLERPAAPSADVVRAAGAGHQAELTHADVEDLQALVAAFAGSRLRARLAVASALRREAGFAFALDPDGGGPLVTGFVDAIAIEADGTVLVVDYKTDRLEGADPATVSRREYAIQRTVYALAVLRDGAPAVEVAHVFLERPEAPAAVRYTQADAAALHEELVGVASGVLSERWPVTDRPHRGLCGDCPARPALCSHPEDVTLREAPAAQAGDADPDAGALAGSGGPS